jgi:hypothetical protein
MYIQEELDPTYAPTRWCVIPAITGRGQLLLGPDPYTGADAAMVFAPPGVLLRGAGEHPGLTKDGWRQARWSKDRYGHVLIDQACPIALSKLTLREVVEDVTRFTPEHLSWVAEIVERHLVFQIGRMVPDYTGRRHPCAEQAAQALFELRAEADRAFCDVDREAVDHSTWYLQEKPFSNLVEAYIYPIRERPTPDRRLSRSALAAQAATEKEHLRLRLVE